MSRRRKHAMDAAAAGEADPDAKLVHLVRKIWTTDDVLLEHQRSRSSSTSSDFLQQNSSSDFLDPSLATVQVVVTRLLRKHREYERKNSDQLTLAVQTALEQVIQMENDNKRQRRSAGAASERDEQLQNEEAAYDQAAAERDAHNDTHGGGGGLNASLRNRYKQVSADRSLQQQQRLAMTLEAGTPTTSNNTLVNAPSNSDTVPPVLETNSVEKTNKKRTLVRRGRAGGPSSSSWRLDRDATDMSSSLFMPVAQRPTERYADLGGMASIIQQVRQLVEYPVTRPELYRHLGVDPPRGVLLRGPPGTGKTHLANAVAGQLGVPFFRVSAPELVSGVSGESESRIRSLFQAASNMAPAIIFLDEIDAVAPKRGSSSGGDGGGSRGMEKRMVAQLLTSMDSVAPHNNRNQNAVIVLAATNRPDSIDPALRRAGRFDKEILLGVPDEDARERILRSMTKGMRLQDCSNNIDADHKSDTTTQNGFDYKLLARKTPGFVGADVKSLAKEAAVIAINRIFRDVLKDDTMNVDAMNGIDSLDGRPSDEINGLAKVTPLSRETLEPLFVTMDDFLAAISHVQPSSQREGFATVPDVSWDDIGALQSIRDELTLSVLEPIRSPEKFKALGLQLPAGVMLYGPPGCGKTLLAKAIAHESGANFISVKGPELLDKYVGESERAVRVLFERARSSSPCIIFFDELDSLVPRRGSDQGGGSGVSERVVNQLLTEMDGLESRRSVFVIAATNRPELIDPAMMRPGRLDKLLYVPLPTPAERVSILRALVAKATLGDDVDLEIIGHSPRAEGYSGADCAALLREAGLAVLKEDMTAVSDGNVDQRVELRIKAKHFQAAFHSVMPSVSKKDQSRYDRIRERMACARSRGGDRDPSEQTKGENVADTERPPSV